MATIPRHMVKEDGRKAGAAMYMAQLPTRRKSVRRPIAGPNFNTIALQKTYMYIYIYIYIHGSKFLRCIIFLLETSGNQKLSP